MNDVLQLVIVTAVAGVAVVAIALPYVRRRPEGNGAPCAKCASGQPCAPADTASAAAPTVHPLRLARPGSPDRR